jgi:hypothetical protein
MLHIEEKNTRPQCVNIILSSNLRSSDLCAAYFRPEFFTYIYSIPRTLCVHRILINLIVLISLKEYKLWNFSLCSFLSSCTFQFPFLRFSTLFSDTYKLNSSVSIKYTVSHHTKQEVGCVV